MLRLLSAAAGLVERSLWTWIIAGTLGAVAAGVTVASQPAECPVSVVSSGSVPRYDLRGVCIANCVSAPGQPVEPQNLSDQELLRSLGLR